MQSAKLLSYSTQHLPMPELAIPSAVGRTLQRPLTPSMGFSSGWRNTAAAPAPLKLFSCLAASMLLWQLAKVGASHSASARAGLVQAADTLLGLVSRVQRGDEQVLQLRAAKGTGCDALHRQVDLVQHLACRTRACSGHCRLTCKFVPRVQCGGKQVLRLCFLQHLACDTGRR